MPKASLKIGNRIIGKNQPVFIIAEAGVNHNANLDTALKMIDIAAASGADAVKFETFKAKNLVTPEAEMADYQKRNLGQSGSQFSMLKKLELSEDFYPFLIKRCQERNIIFLSSAFSEQDVDLLASFNVPAYKVPSGEITNISYLKHVARKMKPIILSTGMSDLQEVEEAVRAIFEEGNNQVIALHCTSNYPPSQESLNMNVITTLSRELEKFNILIGYSDNGSEGVIADIIAVSLGACLIEKHFTLDKSMDGPDHKASLDPAELKEMVKVIRVSEKMLGSFKKQCTPEEEPIKRVARKSIVAARLIKKGELFSAENLAIKRPGTGLAPKHYFKIIGVRAKTDIQADTLLEPRHFDA